MRLKLRRRSVYVGTIVAMFAMVAGFALGAVVLGGTLISHQGGITATPTQTAWSASSIASGMAGSGTCGTAVTFGVPAGPQVMSAYVAGTSAACGAGDITEEIVYSATVPTGTAGTYTDVFSVYSTTGSGSVTNSVSVTITEDGTHTNTVELDLYVDYGTVAGPVTIDSLSVQINGAF